MTNDRIYTDPKGNQRDRVLAVLRDRANSKGYVRDADVQLISRLTGIADHDVAKHLWGMQKQGLIGFSTRHVHGKTVPYRFRLTAKLLSSADGHDPIATADGLLTPVDTALESRPPGRLERMLLDAQSAEDGEAAMQEAVPEPTGRPERAAEPVAGIQGPEPTGTPKEAAPVQEIVATVPMSQEVLDDAQSIMDMRRAPFTAEHYPVIHSVLARVERRERAEEAARSLEAAGLDDLALAALEAIPDFNPLEREILAVVRGFRTAAWDEPGPTVRETVAGIIEERT
jgi:hypothetical protein